MNKIQLNPDFIETKLLHIFSAFYPLPLPPKYLNHHRPTIKGPCEKEFEKLKEQLLLFKWI